MQRICDFGLKMNDPSQMIPRAFPNWQPPLMPPPQAAAPLDPASFHTPRPGWVNWKGKKAADKRKRAAAAAGGGGYQPPALHELQHQNRVKARRFYPKKQRFDRGTAPSAPRNTTSFIFRSKKAGGIAPLVSPCPVTPAILPTPKFSPSREGLVDMAKEEWGVDGYGSMKGLIRLRPSGAPDAADEMYFSEEEDDGESESDSDVEEQHLEVERRLDHDLSRFEMVYPNSLENRVDDQDTHIAHLEKDNVALKTRMFLMEREMGELRRRVMMLERGVGGGDYNGEEVALEIDGGEDVSSERSVGDGEESNETLRSSEENSKETVTAPNSEVSKGIVPVSNCEEDSKENSKEASKDIATVRNIEENIKETVTAPNSEVSKGIVTVRIGEEDSKENMMEVNKDVATVRNSDEGKETANPMLE